MSEVNGVVEATSDKFGKIGILVEGNWYNSKPEFVKETPSKGDHVVFEAKGKYFNKLRVLGKSSAPKGGKSSGFSNLGVELGHASNLAMRVMEERARYEHARGSVEAEPGSTEWYKEYVGQIDTVYQLMKRLRAKYASEEAGESVETEPPRDEPEAAPIKPANSEDIF